MSMTVPSLAMLALMPFMFQCSSKKSTTEMVASQGWRTSKRLEVSSDLSRVRRVPS
jgi:hypothetical protein